MANELREKEIDTKKLEEYKKLAEEEKKWEEGRSARVDSWRKWTKGGKKIPSALAVKPKETK